MVQNVSLTKFYIFCKRRSTALLFRIDKYIPQLLDRFNSGLSGTIPYLPSQDAQVSNLTKILWAWYYFWEFKDVIDEISYTQILCFPYDIKSLDGIISNKQKKETFNG